MSRHGGPEGSRKAAFHRARAPRGLFHRAGKRDVPEAAYFRPVARRVKGLESPASRIMAA